jgi:hypothetical protein
MGWALRARTVEVGPAYATPVRASEAADRSAPTAKRGGGLRAEGAAGPANKKNRPM